VDACNSAIGRVPDLREEWEVGAHAYEEDIRFVGVIGYDDAALSKYSQSYFVRSVSFSKCDDYLYSGCVV